MSRKRPPLTRHEILETALTLVDEHGLDSLSMRKLAAALNVEAMSLYNHVKDKKDLTDSVVNLVLDRLAFPADSLNWQDSLIFFARSMYQTFIQHPSLVPALEHLDDYSAHVIEGMEFVLNALNEAGLSPQQQVAAFRGLNALIMGFVMGHTQGLSATREESVAYWQQWSNAQMRESGLPNLTRLAPYFRAVQPDADFDFVLGLFITALEQQAQKPTS